MNLGRPGLPSLTPGRDHLIDFDLSKRPVRPSAWEALAVAVHDSSEPEENYWLEMKSQLDWNDDRGLGALARAILGMANRDRDRAAPFLEGTGIVIVGLEPGRVHPIEAIDPADLDNKLTPFLGDDGPRWQPHWVKVTGERVLVVEIEAPRNGDPEYTLRKKFGDYRVSQTFVREMGKTELASPADIQRLARRYTRTDTKDSLTVKVGYSLDVPLCKIFSDEPDIEGFLHAEEERHLASLNPTPSTPQVSPAGGSGGMQSALAAFATLDSFTRGERVEEKRTKDEFRAEVAAYIKLARSILEDALLEVAKMAVPVPRFWLSNLSDRNFKAVEVTIRVDGLARAEQASSSKTTLSEMLPKPPRKFGPYYSPHRFAGLVDAANRYTPAPMMVVPNIPSRRDIRNGGSFEVDFRRADLRPREVEVPIESSLVVLVPLRRTEPVMVHWQATASNVDAVAEGEFELPFDGEPIDLLRARMPKK